MQIGLWNRSTRISTFLAQLNPSPKRHVHLRETPLDAGLQSTLFPHDIFPGCPVQTPPRFRPSLQNRDRLTGTQRMQTDPPTGVSASPIADNVMTW